MLGSNYRTFLKTPIQLQSLLKSRIVHNHYFCHSVDNVKKKIMYHAFHNESTSYSLLRFRSVRNLCTNIPSDEDKGKKGKDVSNKQDSKTDKQNNIRKDSVEMLKSYVTSESKLIPDRIKDMTKKLNLNFSLKVNKIPSEKPNQENKNPSQIAKEENEIPSEKAEKENTFSSEIGKEENEIPSKISKNEKLRKERKSEQKMEMELDNHVNKIKEKPQEKLQDKPQPQTEDKNPYLSKQELGVDQIMQTVQEDMFKSIIGDISVNDNQSEQAEMYRGIIESFPDGIQMAFAYGSGAFQQDNSKETSKNMLDFIFVVDKPRRWHRENLDKHPSHYSLLKYFGPRHISKFQESYGAGVYFNTLVKMNGRIIKYGVVSTRRVEADLLDWESLYVAGRLHKPVKFLVVPTDETLLNALMVNLRSAVHAALLQLPDGFTEEQLYMTIAGLSYSGDLRMVVAEDINKVANIVKPNLALFRRMYSPFLLENEHVTWWPDEGVLEQALTFYSRHHHLKALPSNVLHGLLTRKYQKGVFPDLEEIIKGHAYDSECDKHVAGSISNIVKRSSRTQTFKNIPTAGILKSLYYLGAKVRKWFKSTKANKKINSSQPDR